MDPCSLQLEHETSALDERALWEERIVTRLSSLMRVSAGQLVEDIKNNNIAAFAMLKEIQTRTYSIDNTTDHAGSVLVRVAGGLKSLCSAFFIAMNKNNADLARLNDEVSALASKIDSATLAAGKQMHDDVLVIRTLVGTVDNIQDTVNQMKRMVDDIGKDMANESIRANESILEPVQQRIGELKVHLQNSLGLSSSAVASSSCSSSSYSAAFASSSSSSPPAYSPPVYSALGSTAAIVPFNPKRCISASKRRAGASRVSADTLTVLSGLVYTSNKRRKK